MSEMNTIKTHRTHKKYTLWINKNVLDSSTNKTKPIKVMKLQENLIINYMPQINFTSTKNYEMLSLMHREEPNETFLLMV